MKIEEFWRRLRKWCLQAKKGNRNRFVGELWTTQCEDWVFLCLKWSDPFWIFSEISWPDHLWFHKHNMLLCRRRTVCMYIEVTYSVREEYSTWVQTCCTLIYEGGTLFQRRPCLSQTFVINRCSTLWGLQLNFVLAVERSIKWAMKTDYFVIFCSSKCNKKGPKQNGLFDGVL